MSSPIVRCPTCFTSSPAPAGGGEVVCPSCEHAFTATRPDAPARKNPDVPLARALPAPGQPSPPKADPPPARRAPRTPDSDDDRPRTRSRRKHDDDDDRTARRGGGTFPLVLVAGGVLAVLTIGGAVAVAAVLFAKPTAATGPVAQSTPPPPSDTWVTEKQEDPIRVNDDRDPPQGGVGIPRGMGGAGVVGPGGKGGDFRPPLAPRGAEPSKEFDAKPNGNKLVTKHQNKLQITASTEWQSWPATKLIDGQEKTSWYSNSPDNTSNRQYPHVTLTFPEDVSVSRVTILGNRDPEYPTGYTVTHGFVELLDAKGKVLSKHDLTGGGPANDFDLKLATATTARAVRFTMTDSRTGACGLGEFQVE